MANQFQVHIQIGAGVEFYQEYYLTEADGSPLDLTGCVVYGAIAKHSNAKNVLWNPAPPETPVDTDEFNPVPMVTDEEAESLPYYKNMPFNAAVDEAVKGRISIYLAPTATKLLEEGKYVYNVVAKNPSDDVIEVINGLAFVTNSFANFNPTVPTPRV